MYSFVLIYFVLYGLIIVEMKKLNLIVIPVLKVEGMTVKTLDMARQSKSKYNSIYKSKIDAEHYEEATEIPNIDNLEYKDRLKDRIPTDDEPRLDYLDDLYLDENNEDKIVGGFEAEINLYPYHIAYGNNCGGAIIDKRFVVTAGHCGKKSYIKVGSKHLNQGKRVAVKRNYIHPLWTANQKAHPFDFDFQILELHEPLKFNENIQPIKVAHIEDMVIGKVITVTGWGNTEENGPYSDILRAVRVPIISKDHCQRVPFPYFRGSLTSRMFCAGFSEGKKDACQGDSGGPAVAYDRLLGMVSFGYGCATPGSFGVYSKIAKVRPWIEEITGLKLD